MKNTQAAPESSGAAANNAINQLHNGAKKTKQPFPHTLPTFFHPAGRSETWVCS